MPKYVKDISNSEKDLITSTSSNQSKMKENTPMLNYVISNNNPITIINNTPRFDNIPVFNKDNNSLYSKFRNEKDLNEYIETQKMLLDLAKIENEEFEEDINNNKDNYEELDINEINFIEEFKDIDENELFGNIQPENEVNKSLLSLSLL